MRVLSAERGRALLERAAYRTESDFQKAVLAEIELRWPWALALCLRNEVPLGGELGRRLQQAALAMGIKKGATDLIVVGSSRRILWLELKLPTTPMSADQEAFRDLIRSWGFAWALVRRMADLGPAITSAGLHTRDVEGPEHAS